MLQPLPLENVRWSLLGVLDLCSKADLRLLAALLHESSGWFLGMNGEAAREVPLTLKHWVHSLLVRW